MKWITTLILIVGIAANSFAQAPKTPAEEAKKLQVELKLTDLQTTKITTILQQTESKQANDKAEQAKMKSWQTTHNTKAILNYLIEQMNAVARKVEAVLTAEQKKPFQEMLNKRLDAFRKIMASQQ
ncbi:hypothetical protein [Mucilaginibacter polytrichastri]|uniref:LTXXQ motif family protein n=1 Tax=Mucilaginibacter polytrichastri TaxID=1302689 RepID=A0A1Q6A426_9SPHI|nr:hypothetical protein [Mucilaginibacter polytrichastri]OKS88764.1 hypothetical protein RG47T_4242 [Mucilaginibacter polytrichastri]